VVTVQRVKFESVCRRTVQYVGDVDTEGQPRERFSLSYLTYRGGGSSIATSCASRCSQCCTGSPCSLSKKRDARSPAMHRWVRGTEATEVTCLIHHRCHLSCRANHELYPIPGTVSYPPSYSNPANRKEKIITISPSSPFVWHGPATARSLQLLAEFCTRGRRIPSRTMVPEECLLGIPRTHGGRIDWASQPPAGEADARSQSPLDSRDGDRMEWDGTVSRPTSYYQCLGSR
jgi:hypothetical protein